MEQQESANLSSNGKYLGLSLSGGGFRATLFHLGVIRFLYDSGLLSTVTHICSVSGGSVLAAHLVLNWDKYTGSEDNFEKAAQELIDFTQKDVRGRVFRRWFFSFLALGIPRVFSKFSRIDLLESEYNKLYHNKSLSALVGELDKDLSDNETVKKINPVQLHILASSMTNGQAVSFSPTSFQIRDDDTEIEDITKYKTIYIDTMKVSLAVTASSAFPPAFPPVSINHTNLNITSTEFQRRYHTRKQFLTDGGVFDNLGIRKFKWIQDEQNIKFNTIIVSDAQREFEGDVESKFKFIVGRATRSTDLLMNRISWLESDFISKLSSNLNCQILRCQLKKRLDENVNYSLNTYDQSKVHNVRTDLDKFTNDEVNALIHHGYSIARFNYEKSIASEKSENLLSQEYKSRTEVWLPFKAIKDGSLNLRNPEKRKMNIFSIHDIFSWVSLGIISLYILIFVGGYMFKVQKETIELQRRDNLIKKAKEEKVITFNSLRLVDSLANLAMHDDFEKQDTQEDLAKWYQIKEEVISSNTFFEELFNKKDLDYNMTFGESIDEAIKIWKNENYYGNIRNRSIKLGNEIGFSLLQMNDPSYTAWLAQKREEWYQSIENEAREIAKAEKFEIVSNGSIKRFWRLYLGNLCLVEGKLVSNGMARFGAILNVWDFNKGEKPEQIHEAFTLLNDALNKEKQVDIKRVEREKDL